MLTSSTFGRLRDFLRTNVFGTAGRNAAIHPVISALTAYTTPNTLVTGMNASTPAAFALASASTARVVVDTSTPLFSQGWNGIGAAMTDSAAYCLTNYMSATQRAAFLQDVFGPTAGNCTLLRVPMGDSDFIGHSGGQYAYKTYNDVANDTTMANFDASGDLNYIVPRIKDVLAINQNVRIIRVPWTPPAWMKSNNALYGSGGNFVANATNFAAYALYFVKDAQFCVANGFRPWAYQTQNEPNNSPSDYPGCIWAAADMDNFVQNYLRPALQASGFGDILIFAGDAAWNDSGTFVSRSVSTSIYDGYTYHGYDGPDTAPMSAKAVNDGAPATGKPVIMTEMSAGTSATAGPAVSAEVYYYAENFGAKMIANGHNGLIFWNLLLDQQNNPIHGVISSPLGGAATAGLHGVATVQNDTGAITYHTDYWWLKHFRFVQRGAKASKVTTYGADIRASALHNPDGTTNVYLYNNTAAAQTVTITDAVGKGSTQIPLNAGDQATVVYPDPAAGTAAAPSAVSMTASPGNASNSLIIKATANGSAITGIDIYEASSSGAYGSTPLTTLSGNSDPFFMGTFAYVDTSAGNGTASYYKAVVKTAAGNTTTSEVSATPTSSSGPAHYMSTTASGSDAYVSTTTNIPRAGVVEASVWTNLSSYAAASSSATMPLVHTWASASASYSNSGFMFGLNNSGAPTFLYWTADKSFHSAPGGTAVSTVFTPGNGNGIWLKSVFNLSVNPYTSSISVGGSPYVAPSGTVAYFYSFDSTDGSNGTWAQLGVTVTGLSTSSALSTGGVPNVGHDGASGDTVPTGKFYKAVLRDSTGILWNPDFTQAANVGASSFVDTAPSPNTWNVKTANGASLV